jgi:hypothetical protein
MDAPGKCQNCGLVEDKENHKEINYSVLVSMWLCLGCYYKLTRNLFDINGEIKK